MIEDRKDKAERDKSQAFQKNQEQENSSTVKVEEETNTRTREDLQEERETAGEDRTAEEKTEAGENETEELEEQEAQEEIEEEDPGKLRQHIAELESKIEALEQENEQYLNKLQRSKADFANYRQRVNKEKFGLCRKYKKEVIQEILPVLDNLERALESCDREDDFSQGVKMIRKQICSVLHQEGVEEIKTEDQEFDPEFHEAVEQVDTDEHESGKIIEEMQKGYIYQDEVLRPALVVVAR